MIWELFICSTSGPPLNSVARSQNRKYWIIHNCLISNRLCTDGGDAQYVKPFTSLSGTKNLAMFTYTMRNKRVICSQTHSTASTGKELLLFSSSFHESSCFHVPELALPIKMRTSYLWIVSIALAMTNKLVWKSLSKARVRQSGLMISMSRLILCPLVSHISSR